MGKSKKKGGKKENDEFFEQLTKTSSDWQTGPVADMETGEDFVPVPSTSKPTGMDTDDKPSRGIKLGVHSVSMKRGQRTRKQQIRKAKGIEKALARADMKEVLVKTKTSKKALKVALKHVYD